jgi:hypothetical protein
MAKNKQSKSKGTRPGSGKPYSDPWLGMRTGMIVMTIISIGMAALTAFTAAPAIGWGEAIFWGVIFGFGVWLVFGIFFYFNLFIRKKK